VEVYLEVEVYLVMYLVIMESASKPGSKGVTSWVPNLQAGGQMILDACQIRIAGVTMHLMEVEPVHQMQTMGFVLRKM
jgi:hypothetical protein